MAQLSNIPPADAARRKAWEGEIEKMEKIVEAHRLRTKEGMKPTELGFKCWQIIRAALGDTPEARGALSLYLQDQPYPPEVVRWLKREVVRIRSADAAHCALARKAIGLVQGVLARARVPVRQSPPQAQAAD